MADVNQTLGMIEPRAQDVDLLCRQAEDVRHVVPPHEDAVTKAERGDRAVLSEREDDAAFGIGEIDEQAPRAKLLHFAHDIEHQRQGAQSEE